jgi:hypothetical protein
MPDWLIWLAAFWLLFGCGAGCRRAWSHRRLRGGSEAVDQRALESATSGTAALGPHRPGASALRPPPDEKAPDSGRLETALEALQRRFVDGAITLEQYEAALDRLDRRELG